MIILVLIFCGCSKDGETAVAKSKAKNAKAIIGKWKGIEAEASLARSQIRVKKEILEFLEDGINMHITKFFGIDSSSGFRLL